jgi:uncharacterized protein involved in tellurium resistance
MHTAGYDTMTGWGRIDAAAVLDGGDTTPPTVSITSPANGATVNGTITITANASDNVGVTKVSFYIDGKYLNYDTSAPYGRGWNTTTASNGQHTITVKALDAAGNVSAVAARTVIVSNADNVAPTVNITSPANGATVSGTISIFADASDNVGVTKVSFYINGKYLNYDTTAPFGRGWNTATLPNGQHTITVRALDAAGNVSSDATVTVNVNNSDSTPPSVNITSHADGATVSGTISILANATDNVAVTKVSFYIDGKYLNYDLTAPWGRGWNTTTVANGPHTITVRALDAAGNVSADHLITVNVNN